MFVNNSDFRCGLFVQVTSTRANNLDIRAYHLQVTFVRHPVSTLREKHFDFLFVSGSLGGVSSHR